MTSLLIVAHAPLASSLQAVAQHVYPDCRAQVLAVDVAAGATLEGAAEQSKVQPSRSGWRWLRWGRVKC